MNEAEDDPVRVSLLITCVVDVIAPEVGEAAVRTLRAAGCTVSCDLGQTCCGRPAWDAGCAEEAAAVARPTLAALEAELDRGAAAVVVPSASCAAMVRCHWPELFAIVGDADTARRARRVGEQTHEWSALLASRVDHLPEPVRHLPRRLALHHACRLGATDGAVNVLFDQVAAGAGDEAVAWTGADRCCGFAGAPTVPEPDVPPELADLPASALPDLHPVPTSGADAGPRALTDDHLRALAGVDALVGCDTACLLHLRNRAEALGSPVEVRHLAQVVEDALPAGAEVTS
ncbi:MAG TPA: (Fe-S)-binding protein [Acidimicrobiales bacterium]